MRREINVPVHVEYNIAKSFVAVQSRVYFLTYIAYGILHLCRKSYVTMRMKMSTAADFQPILLSIMDTIFMLCYAIGSFFSGFLGDSYPPIMIVAVGLFGSAACVLLLAIFVWVRVESNGGDVFEQMIPVVRSYTETMVSKAVISDLFFILSP